MKDARSHLENSVHDDGNEHVEENGANVLDPVCVQRNLRFFRRLGPVQRHVMTHGNEQLRDRRRHLGVLKWQAWNRDIDNARI